MIKRWLLGPAALLLAASTAYADVNRQLPTSTTDPSGLDGASYADQVAEEVEALWRLGVEPLDSVAGTNTITASPLVSGTGFAAYEEGNSFSFVPVANNTGAVTINIAGRGAKAIKTAAGSALTGGELVSGTLYTIAYDGTDFRLSDGVYDLGAGINGATAKSTPVDADEFAISDSADSNAAKKVTLAELKGVLSGAPTIVDEVEPTSDVSEMAVTGLSDYRDVRMVFAAEITSAGTISVQARPSGGSWTTLLSITGIASGDGFVGWVDIVNFGRNNDMKLYRAEWHDVGNRLDRSDQVQSAASTSVNGYASFSSAEQWDEVRLLPSAGNLEGSTADERSYLIVYGIGDGD